MTSWPLRSRQRATSSSTAAMRRRTGERRRSEAPADLSSRRRAASVAQPLGLLAVLIEPFRRVLRVDAELAGQDLGRCCRGCQPEHRSRPVFGFPHGAEPGHRGGFARPRRADQDVQGATRGGDLLHCHGLVDAQRVVPTGQVGRSRARHGALRDGRPAYLTSGVEQPALGLQEGGRGVDLVALRPESACSIAPAQLLWRVVQLGGGDQKRLRGGQVSCAFGHRDPVLWRGEANSVQLAVDLGQEVGPREGGAAFGHGLHRHAGRIGQDCVGQIAGAQQGQIIAIGETGDPGAVGRFRRSARPAGATGRSSRPGCGVLWPAGSRAWPGGAYRAPRCSSVGDLEPWRTRRPARSCAPRWPPSAGRTRPSGLRRRPSTSKRSCSEWRRVRPSHPHPNASVNRSLSTPWCSSERATTLLNRPRLSSVRHLPSESERARLATTTWSWSWGSPALESQWVNAAATTPSTSSWTTPLVPEREWKTSRSA